MTDITNDLELITLGTLFTVNNINYSVRGFAANKRGDMVCYCDNLTSGNGLTPNVFYPAEIEAAIIADAAKELARQPETTTVKFVGEDNFGIRHYQIASSSTPQVHTIRQNGRGHLNCSCPGYRYKKQCKHLTAVFTEYGDDVYLSEFVA